MRKIILLIITVASYIIGYSQNIGIGTTSPNSSAQIDITSTNKGLLIPRMNTVAITGISNPAKGLMVYDSIKNQLMVNMGTPVAPNWQTVSSNSGWNLNGNSGTNPASQFVGTTDAQPLVLKVNNNNAGYIGITNHTTGFGYQSLNVNAGTENTACGYQSLYSNTTGIQNTAYGLYSLYSNSGSLGNFNTAIGKQALFNTTASQFNTALGDLAGSFYDNGYNNVFLGAGADVNGTGYFNVIAIGKDAICTASSQARIGNSSTSSIGGQVGWTTFSDGRYKRDIAENVPGLDFIMKLRPVTYHLNVSGLNKSLSGGRNKETDKTSAIAIAEKEKLLQTGFVAQEVEKAATDAGYDFSGVDKPKNPTDFYGLRYGEFVVPVIKAMQEQQQQIELLKKENGLSKQIIADLQKRLEGLEKKAQK